MIYQAKARKLVLPDGSQYYGQSFGRETGSRVCELVFNTSPVGYQEILSDPSITASIRTILKQPAPPSAA